MDVVLNQSELAVLFLQKPETKKKGGWQSLIVGLQEKTNKQTGILPLTMPQRVRIRQYAFKYANGGWENRLKATFARHLGLSLDSGLPPKHW